MEEIRKIDSLCPVCFKSITAKLVEDRGKVLIVKVCPEHGDFEDVYYGDVALYKKYMHHFYTGTGVEKPHTKSTGSCPRDCGLCENHKSSTVLANLDVTNDCNFRCPICFANAAVSGYLFEPTVEQISSMMDVLRNQNPPCSAIQFSGGEPTIRKDLPALVKLARQKGFKQVMVATNGMVLAHDKSYAKKLAAAGLSTIYLQFDGVTPEPYIKARGFNALPLKKQVIHNVRRAGRKPNIVLVPTLVRGVNDTQIGSIIRFAQENIDVVRGVNFQPVAFTGRISKEELKQQRITIPDMLEMLEEQLNGEIKKEDFYTTPCLVPFIDFLKRTRGECDYPELSTHPVCGVGTYVFKSGFKIIPITKLINVDELLKVMEAFEKGNRAEVAAKVLPRLHKLVRLSRLRVSRPVLDLLKDIILTGSFEAAAKFHRRLMFIGSMHFMDPYNFDCERVERCCIHYVTPDGRVIPFCSYNTLHRQDIEKKYGRVVPPPKKNAPRTQAQRYRSSSRKQNKKN